MSKNVGEKPADLSSFEWRVAGIRVALRYLLKEKASLGLSLLSCNTVADSFLDADQNAQYLEETKREGANIKRRQESIARIKTFRGAVANDEEWNALTVDILRVCRLFRDMLLGAKELATLKIEKITYEYSLSERTRKLALKFFIGEKVREFGGLKGVALHLAMRDPFRQSFYSDVLGKEINFFSAKKHKKACDAMRVRIEDISNDLSKDFREYGLVDFLKQEKGCFRVNSKFKKLVEPK